ncbi:MAG TPA: hypothetical protein VF360_00460 [Candidatus Methanoperedens sp.]
MIAIGAYVDTLWEICLERASYLLNINELLEERNGKTRCEITDNMKVEFCWNSGKVCYGALVDTEEAKGRYKLWQVIS